MTTVTKSLDAPLAEAVLLNARRYGLTQENLTQFSELMRSIRGEKTAATDSTAQDNAPQTSYSDLIKDYVKHRMTARMQTSIQDSRVQDSRVQDAYAHYTPPNAQDFLMGATGTQRQSSNDISNLLNMHFDLNTLQMLP